MKIRKLFLLTGLFLLVILSGCSSAKGLTKEEKVAKEAVLREAIENRTYIIDVDRMVSASGSSRTLTSNYSLKIDRDNVKSYLPYFGRAYSVPYGGGEGLIFDATVADYNSSYDNKGKTVVEFKTRTKEDQLVYRIEIFQNGSTTININPNNRQSISFYGKASPVKAPEIEK